MTLIADSNKSRCTRKAQIGLAQVHEKGN